jgi:DNA-binding GntR family transcriptional regulator
VLLFSAPELGVTVTTSRIAPSRAADIVCVLEEEIALGQLAPRERIVEEELATRFAAKRHVVRQALSDLETMGIVVRQPNRGAAVRDYSVQEVEQLYVVRALVERCAAELIRLPVDRSVIDALQKIQDRHSAATRKGELRTVFRENLLFHHTFFAICGNAPLVEVIEQMALKTHAIRSYGIGDPALLEVVRGQHQRMIDLLGTDDQKALADVVVQHLQPAKDAYLRLARHSLRRP